MKRKPAHISQADWDAVDCPELTAEDFAKMRPAEEVLYEILPRETVDELLTKKRGRPPAIAPKKSVNIRLAPDILAAFKSTGKGWQTRIDNALRDWLKEHKPA